MSWKKSERTVTVEISEKGVKIGDSFEMPYESFKEISPEIKCAMTIFSIGLLFLDELEEI